MTTGTVTPVANVFCDEPRNLGDQMSRPSRHVGWLQHATLYNIQSPRFFCSPLSLHRSTVIVGGGGLLGFYSFRPSLHYLLASRPRRLILWGAGHNIHRRHTVREPDYLQRFDLVGIRDYGQGYEWVPCVSCLHSAFDRPAPIRHEVVVYEHRARSMGVEAAGLPRLRSTSVTLEQAVEHLSSGRVVLTNSYHGLVWSVWLGRRVVVVNPFSSKFYASGYDVPIATGDSWEGAIGRAHPHPDALADARARNHAFAIKVRRLIDTPRMT